MTASQAASHEFALRRMGGTALDRRIHGDADVTAKVPMENWAKTAQATERALKLREATLAVLEATYGAA